MGSRCAMSLAEEREELCWMCWHQVNVGVRTLTWPQTPGMETGGSICGELRIDSIPAPHTEARVSPRQPLDTPVMSDGS